MSVADRGSDELAEAITDLHGMLEPKTSRPNGHGTWNRTPRRTDAIRRVLTALEREQAVTAEAIEREESRVSGEPMKNGTYPHHVVCSADRRKPLGLGGCVCDNRFKREQAAREAAHAAADRAGARYEAGNLAKRIEHLGRAKSTIEARCEQLAAEVKRLREELDIFKSSEASEIREFRERAERAEAVLRDLLKSIQAKLKLDGRPGPHGMGVNVLQEDAARLHMYIREAEKVLPPSEPKK